MTKVEALKKCRDMWQWLARNPGKDKYSYPFKGRHPICGCYACEYTMTQSKKKEGVDCSICPLLKLWGRSFSGVPCHHRARSPYYQWTITSIEIKRTQYAQQIADFCTSELKRMKK